MLGNDILEDAIVDTMIVDNICSALASTRQRGGNASQVRHAANNSILVATAGTNIKSSKRYKRVACRLGVDARDISKVHNCRLGGNNAWKMARRKHGGGRRIRKELCRHVVNYWETRTRPLPCRRDQKHLSKTRDFETGTHLGFHIFL